MCGGENAARCNKKRVKGAQIAATYVQTLLLNKISDKFASPSLKTLIPCFLFLLHSSTKEGDSIGRRDKETP